MATLMLIVCLVISLIPSQQGEVSGGEEVIRRCDGPDIDPEMGFFTENRGQWDETILFMGETNFGRIALTVDGWWIDLPSDEGGAVLHFSIGGPRSVYGTGETRSRSNYLFGDDECNWTTDVPSFRSVTYESVREGIDLEFRIEDGFPKYDIHVALDANLNDLVVKVSGQERIEVESESVVVIAGNGAWIRESIPRSYRLDKGHEEVSVGYRTIDRGSYAFSVSERLQGASLVIDPLIYSTYLGGSGTDRGNAVAVDGNGCAYVTGYTMSSSFPSTAGAYDPSFNSGRDVFVSKLDGKGSGLVYSTFLGGTDSTKWEEAEDIHVNSTGIATIVARTECNDFPTSEGAYDTSFNGGTDVVIFRLNSTGSGLVYSTYIGGSSMDIGHSLAVDDSGCAYTAGETFSSDLPVSSAAYDTSLSSTVDSFVAKLDGTGSKMIFLSYLGDNGRAYGIAEDDTGVYVTGNTWSTSHPTTPGAYDNTNSGGNDIFVTKFDTKGSTLVYSTYVGGSTHDYSFEMEVNDEGEAYVVGTSWSNNFPTTAGAYDTSSNNIHQNGVVFKMNSTGGTLLFSTYIGGSGTLGEVLRDVVLDDSGNVYFAGDTDSTNYPTTTGAFDTTHAGAGSDCVVSVLDGSGSTLAYSSFLGGSGMDYCYGIARGEEGDVYLTGQTASTDFPTSSGANDTTQNGDADVFVTRLNFTVVLPPSRPQNLSGSMGRGFINIGWEPPKTNGGARVIAYQIYRGVPDETGSRIGSCGPGTLSFNDTTVEIGKAYWYILTCNNTVGPSPPTSKLIVRDPIAPVIEDIVHDGPAISGEKIGIKAVVTDDMVVCKVSIDHWYDEGPHTTSQMVPDGNGGWDASFIVDDVRAMLRFQVTASDVCDNRNVSQITELEIGGDVLPVFLQDISDPIATTGDIFTFRTGAKDNFGIDRVMARIWMDDLMSSNMTLALDAVSGFWEGSVSIPSNYVGPLSYSFFAADINGNTNATPVRDMTVVDDDRPIFEYDLTPSRCTTGDKIEVIVDFKDNIGISCVRLNLTWNRFTNYDVSMELSADAYHATITVPDWASVLEYFVLAFDDAGNMATGPIRWIQVIDDDWPEIIEDSSPEAAFCGCDYGLVVSAIDNHEISRAYVEYWFGEGSHIAKDLVRTDGLYIGSVSVPFDSCVPLSYLVFVIDRAGNTVSTLERTVQVVDDIPPSVRRPMDITCIIGRSLSMTLDPYDNIEVVEITWTGSDLSIEGRTFEWTPAMAGTFEIVVTVEDGSENSMTVSFNVTVTDRTLDSDLDGIPDEIEIEAGLDPFDPTDADGDLDGDGLDNLEEFGLGTGIGSEDTDMDGMPDGWEVSYGLDPREGGASDDTDLDGFTDREEYLAGTDPTAPDPVGDDGKDLPITLVTIFLFIIGSVTLALSIFIFVLRSSKGGPVLPSVVPEPAPVGEVFPSEPSQEQEAPVVPVPGPEAPSIDDWLEKALLDQEISDIVEGGTDPGPATEVPEIDGLTAEGPGGEGI